jgi:predicted ATP-dependent endonuclease of OLD family
MSETKKIIRTYLHTIKLSGYKSISNLEIDLCSDLNIIIGKNAAGKTNFLEFVDKVLSEKFDEFGEFTANLFLKNAADFEINYDRKIDLETYRQTKKMPPISFNLKKNNIDITEQHLQSKRRNRESESGLNIRSIYIKHGIPTDYKFVDQPLNIVLDNLNIFSEVKKAQDYDRQEFTGQQLSNFYYTIITVGIKNKTFEDGGMKKMIESMFRSHLNVVDYLKYFSPIEDIRLNENFNIFGGDGKWTINNLHLQFKVENTWLPFSSLSDGTKRLFYIVSEVLSVNVNDANDPAIVLLEEPELGIHPHQLHSLMSFLKEMSKTRQIIITTHSPQVLDILDDSELQKIILAKSEGRERGTVLHHLNDKQMVKAKSYIKDDFLSDYWLHSDLEK